MFSDISFFQYDCDSLALDKQVFQTNIFYYFYRTENKRALHKKLMGWDG